MDQKELVKLALQAARKAGFTRDDFFVAGGGWAYAGNSYGVIRFRCDGEGSARLADVWKFKPEEIGNGEMRRGRFRHDLDEPAAHISGMKFGRDASHPVKMSVEGLKAVAPAMSDEETRYYLNGVYLDREVGQLVATNGHLLLACDDDACIDGYPGDVEGVIIPSGFVNAVILLADRLKAEPKFSLQANEAYSVVSIVARFEGIEVAFHTYDTAYPDWRCVVPEPSSDMVLHIKRDQLAEAAKDVIGMGRGANAPCMAFSQTGTDMVNVVARYEAVTYEADLEGRFEVTADIDYTAGFDHMDVQLGLNPNYVKVLTDLCDRDWIEAEARYDWAVTPCISEPLRVGLRDNLLAVLMPMRT